jgi:HEAT repeat protein
MTNRRFSQQLLFCIALLCGLCASLSAEDGSDDGSSVPDFTAGGQRGKSHDWLLGPTGLRGWVFFRKNDLTAASRQILVTAVEEGSPADGKVRVNDVILGVFGRPFADDARRSFGFAIAIAEEKSGSLPLMLWRDGKSLQVHLELQVLGAYSATAPYDCPKSRKIFEQGCRRIVARGFEETDIPDHLNALALLASGDAKHHVALGSYARKVAKSLQLADTWNWYIAYGNLFLSEYVLATGDKSVVPQLRETTRHAVKNQCLNGLWGHEPATPSGNSPGYGGKSQISLPMTISLVLARQAGVGDPALDKAIEKYADFARYYVDKGAIPYGDHPAWLISHDDNGKSSCAAVLFDLLGDSGAATYFSRLSTSAYDEREQGHCGNFWNMLWALPGVSRSGPLATGAYLKEQSWYYDLARDWKGGFLCQRIEEEQDDGAYDNWDMTGAYALSFGLGQKSLRILGRNPSVATALDAKAVARVILDGRDRYPEGENNAYRKRKDDELLAGLKSESPIVRRRSAEAIGQRGGRFTPKLREMLAEPLHSARYGATEALGRIGKDAVAAQPNLRELLKDPDPWLQSLAAEALARLGAKDCVAEILAMSLRSRPADPRRMHQRAASQALFSPYPGESEPVSLLADSLEGVDRDQVLLVMRSFLENDDSVVRSSIIPALEKLEDRELAKLLPSLVKAIEAPAPTNEMWSEDIRLAGLDILSHRHIREGLRLCVSSIEWRWEINVEQRMKFLRRYGQNAREVLPAIRKLVSDIDQKGDTVDLSEERMVLVKAIARTEASKKKPQMISLSEFISRAQAQEIREP